MKRKRNGNELEMNTTNEPDFDQFEGMAVVCYMMLSGIAALTIGGLALYWRMFP